MINIELYTENYILDLIDDKYFYLIDKNSFLSGTTLVIKDELNNIYGFINDNIDIPLFIPNKYIGIASDSFTQYLIYKKLEQCNIKFQDTVKTIYLNKPKLKIERYNIDDIENFDFSLLLIKDEPIIYKGKKIIQNYIDINNDIIVTKYNIEKYGDRIIFDIVSPNRLLSLDIEIIWWTEDNKIGFKKNVTVKHFNRQEEGERLRNIRLRQISNLTGLALGTNAEPIVDLLYKNYSNEINLYIEQNTLDFLSAITYETDDTLKYYLNINIPTINYCESKYITSSETGNYLNINLNYHNYMLLMNEPMSSTTVLIKTVNNGNLNGYFYSKDENNNITLKITDNINFDISDEISFTLIYYNTIRQHIIHEIDETIKYF